MYGVLFGRIDDCVVAKKIPGPKLEGGTWDGQLNVVICYLAQFPLLACHFPA